jgi:hypothetical protein
MGVCVEKLPCPDCGSSDSLQSFYDDLKDTHYSICFGKCGLEPKGNPYKEGVAPQVQKKTNAQIEEEVRDIQACKIFDPKLKPWRGMEGSTFKSWGVRLLLSEYDGTTPYAAGFPMSDDGALVGWKVITLKGKKFFSVGDTRDCDPFGLERALKIGGRTLYITEGEYDAIALDYCLVKSQEGSEHGKKMYPVVSLTSGGGSITKNLKKIRKRIKNKFSEVVLVLDDDAVGKAAEKAAREVMPEVLVVDKPRGCKDANDAVIAGLAIEMGNSARWEAHKLPIVGVVRVASILARGLQKPVMGLSYPSQALTEMTYGQRFGEAVCMGAGVGIGKTVTAHWFGTHNMVVHKEPVFKILLEEQNAYTLRACCAQIDGIPYNNPRAEYDQDQMIATAESLSELLFLWESDEDQAMRFDMDEIISAIRFNALEYGCKFVYLDNWTKLVDHLESSAANEFINRYSSEIEGLASQLGLHIMSYSHLNAPKFGPSHEEGAEVYASQFTGSKGIMRSFPMLMSFMRNKHAKGEGMDKNNSLLGVIKNRKYANEGQIKTKYDPITARIFESEWQGELLNEDKRKR